MRKRVTIVLAAVVLSGCIAAAAVRPPVNSITFSETDPAGIVVRKLSFLLTRQPAQSCLYGQWYAAKVLSDPKGYTQNPAYRFMNGGLEVLLVNGACDDYNSYIGKLAHGHFTGTHDEYGLGFSKTVGQVVGEYVQPKPGAQHP
jgi:hypothetical protein